MPLIKLTDELKQEIKDFFYICKNKTAVAEKFQISIPTVYRVLTGKVYTRSIRRITPVKEGYFNENQFDNWLC